MRTIAGLTAGLRRFLDLLLIVLILVVLGGVILGKLVPLTGHQTLIVGGPSMEPSLGLGSAIIIEPVPADALAVGDVISLKAGTNAAVFTHRIIEIVDRDDGRWVRTKGDANDSPDPTLVPASAIIGRVTLSIPYAGYLLALLSLPTGILFLLGLAATLLASAWLLESLELETVVPGPRSGDEPPPSRHRPITERAYGEPIAARPMMAGPPAAHPTSVWSLAAQGAFGGERLGVPDRLAVARETRQRRASWQADGRRRADRLAE